MTRLRWSGVSVSLAALLVLSLGAPAGAQKSRTPSTMSGSDKAEAICGGVADVIWELTDVHWHKGEYSHIVHLCRMMAAARPRFVEAYANAGWLLWSMNRDAEAVAFYQQGIQANPHTFYLYDELGTYYYNHKRDWANAARVYEKAAEFKDCPPVTLHMLAHAYERNGQLEKALAVWKRAATLPENAPAKRNIERVQQLIKKKGGQKN